MTQMFITIETMKNLKRGTNGMGLNSSDEVYVVNGHYPLVDNKPTYDVDTQRITSELVVDEVNKIVNKVYTISNIPQEELIEKGIKDAEEHIQSHINEVVKGLGYDNENSIAKYLVDGNPFYDECSAISLWIGNVWVTAFTIQQDVLAGNRAEPTTEELLAELPELNY
jgi:hypothetical protein